MREVKMAELKIEAPLAKTEEWTDYCEYENTDDYENFNKDTYKSPNANDGFVDNFSDTFSTSLEDLVNTFDDKITKCFCNYDEKVEKFAPVQVRSQEEIMNECQMWWTLTGNFGNILPIDWSKSCARLHMPSLNLNQKRDCDGGRFDDELDKEDMHSLIISGLQQEPVLTAEQVLEEIDEMMQAKSPSGGLTCLSPEKSPEENKIRSTIITGLCKEKLNALNLQELNEILTDLEQMIQEHSEILIQQLALRDELEFEKELKNTFISLLLSIQNRRRQYNIDKKRGRQVCSGEPKYLNTVIPYDAEQGLPDNGTLQILIKILQAISDDSPTVPTLLTDYILKVLCPT
ncbi:fasciculation and elongation protein zeta-2-like [Centruroides vittatus]|uniref:fasciculation and elongation protein zeta-2-like n=1 Tax=Centruroides vittatus TaxID=120091 RepID=UPI00350F3C0E